MVKLTSIRKAAYAGSVAVSEHSMANQLKTTEKPTGQNYLDAAVAFGGLNPDTGEVSGDHFKQAWTPTGYLMVGDYITSKVGFQKWLASRFR